MAMLAGPAGAQNQTLAHLDRESSADIPRPIGRTSNSSHNLGGGHPASLPASALARAAANALFVDSELARARTLATQALQGSPRDIEALFVRMETAGMEADTSAMLDAAVKLCEVAEGAAGDVRVRLAAVRIREAAANTPAFRAAIPQVQTLLADSQEPWPDLLEALLKAAMDGAPGLDPYAMSRGAGILTDWRIVGPLDNHALIYFEQEAISPADDLAQASYQNRAVENFQFPDGRIVLPDYLARRGTFYAAAHFSSLTAARYRMSFVSAGAFVVYVDGRVVARGENKQGSGSTEFEASAGPHRLMVKFAGAAAPLRIAVLPTLDEMRPPLPSKLSLQELTYRLAAEHYANGEFGMAISQIEAVPSSARYAALQFLLAQSWTHAAPASPQGAAAWAKLLSIAPGAFAADDALAQIAVADGDFRKAVELETVVLAAQPADAEALATITRAGTHDAVPNEANLWARRIVARPSCEALLGAMNFYRAEKLSDAAKVVQQKLNGCAPESTVYAASLSERGRRGEAVRALQQLLAAAPLNRAARLMLVRELQLSGQDEEAQQAAAKWLHIAPNAENYHRLAAAFKSVSDTTTHENAAPATEFYQPYRRDAGAIAGEATPGSASDASVVLLDDHVAISRTDGSVSMYVHNVRRLLTEEAVQQFSNVTLPQGAQVLALRILHRNGTPSPIEDSALSWLNHFPVLIPGDSVEEEYVLHYAGDGGIQEHCEAFQFVFGSFNEQVLHARFVVLTPGDRADQGVVIATGGAPEMTVEVRDGMLQRVWEKDGGGERQPVALDYSSARPGSAIVRVVQEENGWSIPSDAEHHRRIETIHPGPRPEDS